MRINNEKEIVESGKVLALTMALMNILIFSVVLGMFWFAQFLLTQQNQLLDVLRGSMVF